MPFHDGGVSLYVICFCLRCLRYTVVGGVYLECSSKLVPKHAKRDGTLSSFCI